MLDTNFNILGKVLGVIILLVATGSLIVILIGVFTFNSGMILAGLFLLSWGVSILVLIASQIFRYQQKVQGSI